MGRRYSLLERKNYNRPIIIERLKTKEKLKRIFFLVGLPRAGNTLLSSILNQNSDIAVTANSITADIVYNLFILKDITTFKNFPDHKSFNNIAHHVFDLYYKDWKQKYIIDRSCWGTRENLRILKETHKDIKIIVLTRDLIEVLASFILWSDKNPNNFHDRTNLKTIEERCENLMQGSILSHAILAIENLLLPENKDLYLLIRYNDLINNPNRVIKKIYKYLEIPPFQHHYTNLNQFKINGIEYNDDFVGRGLHHVKTDKIIKSTYDAYSVIPKSIIQRYKREWLM